MVKRSSRLFFRKIQKISDWNHRPATNLRRSSKHGRHVIGKRSIGLGFVEETPIHDALLLVPLHTDPLEGDHHRSAAGLQEDPPKNATGLGIAIVVPQPLPASPTGLEGVELIQLCMVPGLGGVVDHVIGLHQNLHPLEKGARRLIRQNFAKIKEVTWTRVESSSPMFWPYSSCGVGKNR